MMTENNVKDLPETKENEEPARLLSLTKKEKNPKRVAAGKKGVEARKIKAEFKRKEAELLKKENLELKENSLAQKQITKDDETFNTDYALRTNKPDKDSNKDYKLICLSIGIVGLGLYIYNQRKQSQASEASSTLRTHSKQIVPILINPTQKKEIDPFEF